MRLRPAAAVAAVLLAATGCSRESESDASDASEAGGSATSSTRVTAAERCEGVVLDSLGLDAQREGLSQIMERWGPKSAEGQAYQAAVGTGVFADMATRGTDRALEDVRSTVQQHCSGAVDYDLKPPTTDCGDAVIDALEHPLGTPESQEAYEALILKHGIQSPEFRAHQALAGRQDVLDAYRTSGTMGMLALVSPEMVDDACSGQLAPEATPTPTSEPEPTFDEPERPTAGGSYATELPTDYSDLPTDLESCEDHMTYWSQVATKENYGNIAGAVYGGRIWGYFLQAWEKAVADPSYKTDPQSVANQYCANVDMPDLAG